MTTSTRMQIPFLVNIILTFTTTKGVLCTLSDFTRFLVNSFVVVNEDKQRSNEFTSVVNKD
jgi:hypothetical protein